MLRMQRGRISAAPVDAVVQHAVGRLEAEMTPEEPTVPGEFKCPECGFVLMKSILNPTTLAVSRDSTDRLEPCPNDGAILRPVSYREALEEARAEACRSLAARNALDEIAIALNDWWRERLATHQQRAAEWRKQQERSKCSGEPWAFAEEMIERDYRETVEPVVRLMGRADEGLGEVRKEKAAQP